MDIQNAEFDADFESIEKAAKKSHEKVKEEWSFWPLLLCEKVVGLYLFLSDFLHFYQQIWIEHQILLFTMPISNLEKKCYAYIYHHYFC